MVSRVGGNSRQRGTVARQLPITNFAHKAGVVGNTRMRAVLAALDMTAERGSATNLDRRHDAPLGKTHVAGVGFTPRRSMAAENIRDLQPWTRHARCASGGRLGLGFILLGR
jgi:hypothetical protein